jgi:histidine ammonia-lyase
LEDDDRGAQSEREPTMTIALDGNSLTLETYDAIVRGGTSVALSGSALDRLTKARRFIDAAVGSGKRTYSLNTGFGVLSKVTIDPNQLDELQVNLIRSHCVGVGPVHSPTESRGMLLLRANVLAKGYSGVRPMVVQTLVRLLNAGIAPVVPSKGSVGASGDLAPLAHLASVLIGEGEAFLPDGRRVSGAEALRSAGLEPLKLAPKEGLALINGTQQMTAVGALLALEAARLLDIADLCCAASVDGTLGSPRAFLPWIHEARPHAGQRISAARIAAHLAGSAIAESHKDCGRVQDAYSFRCAPQVHGSARDLVAFAERTLTVEMNAATDNPLVHPETGEIVSGGNFHGQPVAAALDVMAMGVAELGSIAERRIAKLVDPSFSELPAFLVKNEGLNSGFMMAQVTAAALCSENKLLTHPASSDSIPTNNEKEDHVSMGPIAANKLKTIVENTSTILAIEALCACQAIDFRRPLVGGRGVEALYSAVRARVPPLDRDRALSPDIEAIVELFRSSAIENALSTGGHS